MPAEQRGVALPRPAVTVAQAADALQVTPQTIFNLINRGQLRRFKIGRATRIPTVDVLNLVGGDDDTAA